MRKSNSNYRLYLFQLLLFFAIPIMNYMYHTYSYGFFLIATYLFVAIRIKYRISDILTCIFFVLAILTQVYFTSGFSNKAVVSAVVLAYCCLIFFGFGSIFRFKNYLELVRNLLNYVWIVTLFVITTYTLSKYAGFHILPGVSKPCFPFTEPSHFALFLCPICFFIFPALSNLQKIAMCSLLIFCGLYLQSLVFLSYAFLLLILQIGTLGIFRTICIFFATTVIISLSDFYFLNGYIYYRLYELFNPISNMSVLVYLQGWQNVKDTLFRWPFGLGFQALGTEPPNFYSELIMQQSGGYVNRKDGGFLLAKVYPETGVFFIMAFSFAIYFIRHSVNKIRPQANIVRKSILFFSASFIIPMFIRDVGYFSYTVFYFCVLLGAISALRNKSFYSTC